MGFGLVFVGYFLTVFNIPVLGMIGSVIRLIGLAIMFYGFDKLKNYENKFLFAQICTIAAVLASLLSLSVGIDAMLYEDLLVDARIFNGVAQKVIEYVDMGVTLLFNTVILWAVFSIAKETEVKKIVVGSVRNFVFMCFYLFTYLISLLPFAGIRSAQQEFSVICWILYYAWVILNVILFFNCYAMICDEDDVEMDVKPSRFAFVNKIREEHEKRSQKAREADEVYRRERISRKRERKQRRNKK